MRSLRQGFFWWWFNEGMLSVQFSHSVMSDSLRHHGLQHARLPCPSPTPRTCSNSCPLSQWCHPTMSSSVIPFSSCLQSFPASAFFPMRQFFASDGASASASVLPMNVQNWFPLRLVVWSPCKGLSLWRDSQVSSTPQFKSTNSLALSFLYILSFQHVWERVIIQRGQDMKE